MSEQERGAVGVLVVDDQAHFRRVAVEVIEATPGFESVGAAASGDEALALVAETSPDLVLVDVRMPVMDGLETTRRLRAARTTPVIVLVSIDGREELPREVDSCGARTLLRKQDFGPLALRRLWEAHGAPGAGPAPSPS